jgi:hypothetical protein
MSHAQMDAMFAEAGIAPHEAAELAHLLAPLNDPSGAVAVPSAELRVLFGEQAPAARCDPSRLRSPRGARRGRGAVVGAVVLALSGVGATGLSAAANSLPDPWQHHVSDFSRHYLPFHFPQPATGSRPPGHTVAPGSSPKPHRGGADPAGDALREDDDEASRSMTDARAGAPTRPDVPAFVTLHGSGGSASSPGPAQPTPLHSYTPAPAAGSADQGVADHGNHGQTASGGVDHGSGPDKGPDKGPGKGSGGGSNGGVTHPSPTPDKSDKPPNNGSGGPKGPQVILGQDPLGDGKGQVGKPGAGSGGGGSGEDQPGAGGGAPGPDNGGSPDDQGAPGHDDPGPANDTGVVGEGDVPDTPPGA